MRFLTLLLALVVAGSAIAQETKIETKDKDAKTNIVFRKPDPEAKKKFYKELNLTPEQIKKVEALGKRQHDRMQKLVAGGARPSMDEVRAAMADYKAEMKKILNKEQFAKFEEKFQRRTVVHKG